jgi:hypothetical protein
LQLTLCACIVATQQNRDPLGRTSTRNSMIKSTRLKVGVELLSAAAVVATLIFLAVEVRQNTEQAKLNTRAIEVSAYQDLIAQIAMLNVLTIENPQFAEVEARWGAGDTLFTPAEKSQMASYIWLLFRHGDLAFHQFELGLISRQMLQSALGPLLNPINQKAGFSEEWALRRQNFHPAYRAFVDSLFEVPR